MQPPLAPERTQLLIAAALVLAALALGGRRGRVRTHPTEAAGAIEGAGRGRSARRPGEIPARGSREIAIRIYRSISDDRILTIAAGVTFYALLALFPAIAALVSLYGLFAEPATIGRHLESAGGFLPGGAIEVVREQMTRVAEQAQGALGFGVITGLALSLWSANSGVKALMDALNAVYREREKRGFFRLNAVSLAFTLGAVLFLLVAIGAIVALPIVLQYLPLRGLTQWLAHALRWPALLLAVVALLVLLYRYGPSRDSARRRRVSWGSAFAGLVWVGASALFSWYAENFGSYNATYGSLGAVIGFMTWIWISTIVILIGGKINAEIEHQTMP